jgi:hypothetical protein
MRGHGLGNCGSEAAGMRHDSHQETIAIVRRQQELFSRSRKDTIARRARASGNICLLVCVVTFCICGASTPLLRASCRFANNVMKCRFSEAGEKRSLRHLTRAIVQACQRLQQRQGMQRPKNIAAIAMDCANLSSVFQVISNPHLFDPAIVPPDYLPYT